MTGERVLVLGGAARSQGARCLEQARQRGLEPVLADRPEHLRAAPEIVALAGEVVQLDYADVEACRVWAASSPAAARGLVGVVAFREYAMLGAAVLAEALGLPGNPSGAIVCVRDKHRCREALRRLGFDQPRSARCGSAEEVQAFVREGGPGPWVVKPAGAMGSLGVTRADDEQSAVAAWAGLTEAGHQGIVVEAWQDGAQFSAEGYFEDGEPHVLALTRKYLVPESFVELGHALPVLDAPLVEHAPGVVGAALRGLGLRFGYFHVEFWVDGEDVVLGEVHARPGGDYLHWLVELTTGVQTYGAQYDEMIGRRVTRTSPTVPAAAVSYLVLPPGRVTSVGDVSGLASTPGCLRLDLDLTEGTSVQRLRDSFDRCGFAISAGADEAGAWVRAQELTSGMRALVGLAGVGA